MRGAVSPWLAVAATAAALAVASGAHAAEIAVRTSDASGKPLADAIVYLVPAGAAPAPASKMAKIDQVAMEFTPLVTVIQSGTKVEFPNSDNTRHQVYSFSPSNPFTLKLYSGKPAAPVTFAKPGNVVIGCNIHDHMVAWVLVVDTPWFARADDSGTVRLTDVPAGEYALHVWHPGLAAELPAEPIRLGANDALRIDRKLAAQTVDAVRRAMGKSG